MLPALTAVMISNSLGRSVPPGNSIASSPFEASVISLAISAKAMAEDSGGGVTWAKISFFGVVWANAGAWANDRAAAPAACITRRRVVVEAVVTGSLPGFASELCAT